jgi:hypothetical protein
MRACAISKSLGVGTAIIWFLVLLASVLFAGPHGAFAFDSLSALIGDVIFLIVVCIVVASVLFAWRPRRWLAWILFIVSLIPACLSGYSCWTNITFLLRFRPSYSDPLRAIQAELIWILPGLVFVTLALLWAATCFRWYRTKT